jgi:hypothetical protein
MLRSGVIARLLLRPGGIRGPGDKARTTGQDKPPVGTTRSTARYCMYCTVLYILTQVLRAVKAFDPGIAAERR